MISNVQIHFYPFFLWNTNLNLFLLFHKMQLPIAVSHPIFRYNYFSYKILFHHQPDFNIARFNYSNFPSKFLLNSNWFVPILQSVKPCLGKDCHKNFQIHKVLEEELIYLFFPFKAMGKSISSLVDSFTLSIYQLKL